MTRNLLRLSAYVPVIVVSIALGGCSSEEAAPPPVATPSLKLSAERAPAGSPLEITYEFLVADNATFSEDFRVFVHVVDTDEERMWDDDHNPPTPTSQWKPGQTIKYTRTIFVPVFPYVGDATIRVGLHSLKDQRRLALNAEDVGQRAYRVARLQLLPQTDNLFTIFKEGWHMAEAPAHDANTEWQWTKRQATLTFKNPKKDSVLFLDADSPGRDLHAAQSVQIHLGGQVVEQFALDPEKRELRKIKLPGTLMGDAELAELQVVVDPPFVPQVVSGGKSKDTRELGIRVFHAYVDPR